MNVDDVLRSERMVLENVAKEARHFLGELHQPLLVAVRFGQAARPVRPGEETPAYLAVGPKRKHALFPPRKTTPRAMTRKGKPQNGYQKDVI